jgi:hypothetical protein
MRRACVTFLNCNSLHFHNNVFIYLYISIKSIILISLPRGNMIEQELKGNKKLIFFALCSQRFYYYTHVLLMAAAFHAHILIYDNMFVHKIQPESQHFLIAKNYVLHIQFRNSIPARFWGGG